MAKSKNLEGNTLSGDKSSFSLSSFKKTKGFESATKFKKQRWIPFSPAMKEALSIPGIPMGQIFIARGGSDTGKTTLLLEAAVTAQKMGILPVFIITEMKWDFEHASSMGLEVNAIPDEETGEVIDYDGFFLYIDRGSINAIEDVSAFILDIFNEQAKGRLPYDLLFLWDSVGSLPCQQSIDKGSNNPMWNAGAMATQFGNFVNQQFPLTRKEKYPYTNTFFVINKTGVQPALTFGSQPKRTNKAGDTMYWDAAVVATFGNITNSGTSKIKATRKGKSVEFAKRTKIAVDKVHVDFGVATASTVIVTPHGFISDTPAAVNEYKKKYAKSWFNDLKDSDELDITEDNTEWDEKHDNESILDADNIEE